MENKTKLSIFLTLLIIAGFVGLSSYVLVNRDLPNIVQISSSSLNTQVTTVGSVEITVTPLISKTSYEFNIELTTHTVELDYNLATTSTLTNEKNQMLRPINWEGDAPGGHHRKGKLTFTSFSESPKTLNLTIIGIEDQNISFKWDF